MATAEKFDGMEVRLTARSLVKMIYVFTGSGASCRDFALRDRIQRAAVFIMSNIADGFEGHTQRRFIEYIGHAKASAGEVRSQLYMALDLAYITQSQFSEACELVLKASRQIYRLMDYLESLPNNTRIREDLVPCIT